MSTEDNCIYCNICFPFSAKQHAAQYLSAHKMANAAPNTPRISQSSLFTSLKVFTLPTTSAAPEFFTGPTGFRDIYRRFCVADNSAAPQTQTSSVRVLTLLLIEDKRKFRGGRKPPSGSTDRRVMSGGQNKMTAWGHFLPEFFYCVSPETAGGSSGRFMRPRLLFLLSVFCLVSPSTSLPTRPNRCASPHRRCALTSLLRARTGLELCLSHSTCRSARRRGAAENVANRFLFPLFLSTLV